MEKVKTSKAVAVKKQINVWGVKEKSTFKKAYAIKAQIEALKV